MATYYIVDKDTDPLGPDEIAAGSTIQVNEGDVFIFTDAANANTKFESADGTPTDFEVYFTDTPLSGYDVEIKSDLTAAIGVGAGVDLSSVKINASGSDGTTTVVQDGATLGEFTGSGTGADVLTIGNGVTASDPITLGNGDNVITIGDNNTFLGSITTGNGTDSFTAGDGNTFTNAIDLGDGTDTATFGDNNYINLLWTGNDADTATVGLLDTTQSQVIDGVAHDGADGDPLDDDTVSLALSDADMALLEAELLANGYVQTGKVWSAGPGADYHVHVNNVEINDWEYIRVVCFTPGTLIETPEGPRPVETLGIGDTVVTADHGPQPLRWIGRQRVPARGRHAPVFVPGGPLGNRRPLLLSPQHRILLSDPRLAPHFDTSEVLAPAKGFVGHIGIRRAPLVEVDYFHLLFDRHEVLFANGLAVESLYLPDVRRLDEDAALELAATCPQLAGEAMHEAPARRLLKTWEAACAASLMGFGVRGSRAA